MKAKRKRNSAAFKAKVGFEALMGLKTVAQLAREYAVHPAQVTQWWATIQDPLPELFEPGPPDTEDHEQLIARHADSAAFCPMRSWNQDKVTALAIRPSGSLAMPSKSPTGAMCIQPSSAWTPLVCDVNSAHAPLLTNCVFCFMLLMPAPAMRRTNCSRLASRRWMNH